MKQILVIGGAGYIGSHVVLELLSSGYSVDVIDNLSTGHRENIPKNVSFFEGDLLDRNFLDKAIQKKYDSIVHLAAKKAPGESMSHPEIYATNNISGTINILEIMVKKEIKNIVFSSTAAVYGEPEYLPMDEKHPTNPINFYGHSKLVIENIFKWFGVIGKINFVALRYFNAAGYDREGRVPGIEIKPANLLPIVMETAAGLRKSITIFGNDYKTDDGTCIRDYIHVSDLASAHIKAIEYLNRSYENLIVNLGSENSVSVLKMIEKAKAITGVDIPFVYGERREGDPAEVLASSEKAWDVLKWKAESSSVESLIESTWNQYKKIYKV